MSDVTLRGFPPEHRDLALLCVSRYERDHPDARHGMAGACSYDWRKQYGVRLYVYTTKTGDLVAVCEAIEKKGT